ncbi:hypothetical protein [Helicobacter zhangjianzhongii]|uniref:Uncharacterized protein n=1 Tax=Helicobacter zhangjianzhongii TaxID=2974574 RepID=A0ACC6FQN8_9HELI|nr:MULTISPECIES: hypothetical protein [unclassified Helicobacter]MDL0079671.1 hypothetical protein [Helicobacter sp. CPD2-1]MDL0081432.1 hypothetical protein [Helicobacter sp. XJK30-2]
MRLESTFEKVDSSGKSGLLKKHRLRRAFYLFSKETAWGLLPRGAKAPLAMTEKRRFIPRRRW